MPIGGGKHLAESWTQWFYTAMGALPIGVSGSAYFSSAWAGVSIGYGVGSPGVAYAALYYDWLGGANSKWYMKIDNYCLCNALGFASVRRPEKLRRIITAVIKNQCSISWGFSMGKNKAIGLIFGSIGLVGAVIAAIQFVYNVKNPAMFASKSWNVIKVDEIKSVMISPLLSENSIQGLTINKDFTVKDRKSIRSLWQEMQGKEKRVKHAPGHWTHIKGLKVTYNLDHNTKFAFRITFHASRNVADYYMLKNAEDNFYIPNFAGKGSEMLYNILHTMLNSQEIRWVSDNPIYWHLEVVPKFKEDQ